MANSTTGTTWHAGKQDGAGTSRDDPRGSSGFQTHDPFAPIPPAIDGEMHGKDSHYTDRVRVRAYELWENDGRPDGAHEAHWYEAMRQIDGEDEIPAATKQPAGADRAAASRSDEVARIEADAAPQKVRTRKGSRNSGISSVEPRVISGDEGGDATSPLKQDKPGSLV